MKRLFVFLLLIFTISISFADTIKYSNADDFYLSDLENVYFEINQKLNYKFEQEESYYRDIVSIAKREIFKYYNKTTFEEPEWVRVKNFLFWLDNNKDSLNAYFHIYLFYHQNFDFFTKLPEIFIGSFLGANYITKNLTGKNFELQIVPAKFRTSVYEKGGIRIKADNMVTAINRGIHEATHILPVNDKSFIGKEIEKSNILSEEATILSQLKYCLPLKIEEGNILSGSRTGFMLASTEFTSKYLDILVNDYAEAVLSITKYSYYWRSPSKLFELKYSNDNSIKLVLKKLLYYKALSSRGKDFNMTDIDPKLISSPVYEEAVNEVYNTIFANKIEQIKDKSLKNRLEELFENNELFIMYIFFKNLQKYADPNIPPVPEGYI